MIAKDKKNESTQQAMAELVVCMCYLVGKTSGKMFMGMLTRPQTMVLHSTCKHSPVLG